MGLRYRKSINLGGGFRVNLSKSGIGYSWGTKGYRITKKAGGGTRRTYSLPGTGLSWVDEKGKNHAKKNSAQCYRNKQNSGTINTYQDVNYIYEATDTDLSDLINDQSRTFLDSIKKYSLTRGLLIWIVVISFVFMFTVPVFALLFVAAIAGWIYVSLTKKISVEYECDEYGAKRIHDLDQAMSLLRENAAVWQVNTIQASSASKVNAGASQLAGRSLVSLQKKKPYFLNTDATCYYVKLRNDKVYILPDRLILKGKKGWGIVDYDDLNIDVGSTFFIESSKPPKDAKIVDYRWLYVNKNGSPDKRYSNNRQLPRCQYGELDISAGTGFNIILYLSNVEKASSFRNLISQMLEDAKQAKLSVDTYVSEDQNTDLNLGTVEMESFPSKDSLQDGFSVGERRPEDSQEHITAITTDYCDFSLDDVMGSERIILQEFKKVLAENGLSTSFKVRRDRDGSVTVNYKGNVIGAFNVRSGQSWITYPIGKSGKTKHVDGDIDTLSQEVSKWVRYIINYL